MEQNLNRWNWTNTGKHHDVNLIDNTGNTLLSNINIDSEFREWLSPYNLNLYNILFVYGSALGYPVRHLLSWLELDKSRRLVVLEDDKELYEKTLSRDELKRFIKHPQVAFYYLPDYAEEKLFYDLSQLAGIHQTLFITSPHADNRKGEYYKAIYEFIRYGYLTYINEFLDGAESHFKNFYKNISKWVEAAPLSAFFNQFKDIPAIVVGAGPSLGKNIDLIKKYKHKALLVSGGTAVNGMNAHGLDPHLSIGLDPFETTISRSLAATSFLSPFIYKERMNAESLSYVHGPLIYLDGGMTFLIEKWFQEKFNLINHPFEMGTNVLNCAISVAYHLGCRNIVLTGIDLALSDNQIYAPKIRRHATTLKSISAMGPEEEVLLSKDIFGKPINTLKKWLRESIWIGDFQLNHPDAKIINSTEGGIGFPHIQNVPLKHLSEFKDNFDIEGLIHSIWASHPVGATKEKLKEAFKELVTSLGKVLSQLIRIGAENPEKKASFTFDMSAFKGELGYDNFLKEFEEIYDKFYKANLLEDGSVTPYMTEFKRKIPFLIFVIQLHLKLISETLDEWEIMPVLERDEGKAGLVEHKIEEGESRYYYNQHLLAKTEWNEGQIGSYSYYYYLNGKVALSKKFKGGQLHGSLIAYYPDGVKSAELEYVNGALDGVQHLYYQNGALKRKIQFKNGLREGADLIYNSKGDLINESYYEHDKPIKYAYVYYPGKRKALEIHYNEKNQIILSQEWDEKGNLKKNKVPNYLASITGGTTLFGAGLLSIHGEIRKTLSAMSEKKDPEMMKDIQSLEQAFEKLKNLSQELEISSQNEALNTPQLKETIKRELTKYHLEMGDIFASIEQHMKDLKEKREL